MMIKCKIKIERILFPKNVTTTNLGDYCIVGAKVVENYSKEKIEEHFVYRTISLKGILGIIKAGDVLKIEMELSEKNNYGTTYKVIRVISEIDINNKKELNGYYQMLFGKSIAEKIKDDKKVYEYLQTKNRKELLKIKGVGEAIINRIFEKLDSFSGFSKAFAVLEPMGLTKNQIKKICNYTGDENLAIEICETNPYALVNQISGLGFKTIDKIALSTCKNINETDRLTAAILATLMEESEVGKSYLRTDQLLKLLSLKLDTNLEKMNTVCKHLIENKKIMTNQNSNMFALPRVYDLEVKIATEIKRIQSAKNSIDIGDDWKETIKNLEEKQNWCFTDEQLEAIELMLKNNFIVISGKAGTGKTTLVNAIRKVLKKEYSITMCCLAAKAAQRLREVTQGRASTIHKLLNIGIEEEKDKKDNSYILEDIVVVDEASMISGDLFLKLLRKIRTGSKIIILGDQGQLNAIGNCCVFGDLIECKSIDKLELTKIHRQARKSAIITKSIDIRNQKMIVERNFKGVRTFGELQDLDLNITDFIQEEVLNTFIENLHLEKNILETQIITGIKSRGTICTNVLNQKVQALITDKSGASFVGGDFNEIYVGDKVINTINEYQTKNIDNITTPIFNGSIGIVEKITKEFIFINFTGIGKVKMSAKKNKNINLAYAITVHSSQGSQWNRVICCFDMSQFVLLNVEMLYTAITRAAKKAILITNMDTLKKATDTVEQNLKQTFLREML